ncbi:MAG: S8 family peptidase [Bacteroidetes bacterium]|nr:S8 family peptidase [Bacteroidota bacterium]MDA1268468.1 S8 family peptidase [Bacteroidota bacterium]
MSNSSYFLALLLCFSWTTKTVAQDRYAVFFKFKPQEEYSLASPSKFLTEKALQRRLREKFPLDSLDLPVTAAYIQGISSHSQKLLYVSKWLNAAVVVTDAEGKKKIEGLPFVQKVDWIAKGFISRAGNRNSTEVQTSNSRPQKWVIEEGYRQAAGYDFQNQLLGIPDMHKAGYTGKGITIAIFDSGFSGLDKVNAFSHIFINKQVVGQLHVVRPWVKNIFRDDEHGTQVASLILANQAETLVAGAHQAQVIFAITEDVATEYPVEELNWVRAAEYADSLGVDIINSSLGYLDFDEPSLTYTKAQLDGKTTYISRGASIAAKRGILVVNSVGNYGSAGSSSLVAPADAQGILAVGAVNSSTMVSSFSSRGPTADGRVKPELSAFGQNTILIRSSGQVSSASGTSFSAPQIAALAAGLWEAKPNWTKDELLTNLLKSGSQYASPDQNLGYGIPNFQSAYDSVILGLNEEVELGLNIYPNPLTTESLNIRFGKELRLTLQVLDSSGRSVLEKLGERNSIQEAYVFNLSNLPSGIYFIQLLDGKEIAYRKLVKL